MATNKYQALKELKELLSNYSIFLKKKDKDEVDRYYCISSDNVELDEDDIVINIKYDIK